MQGFLRRKAMVQFYEKQIAELSTARSSSAPHLASTENPSFGLHPSNLDTSTSNSGSSDTGTSDAATPDSFGSDSRGSRNYRKGWSGFVVVVLSIFGFVAHASATEPVKAVSDKSSASALREGAVRRRRNTQSRARGRTAKRPSKRTKSSWLPKMSSSGASNGALRGKALGTKDGSQQQVGAGQEKAEAPKAAEQDKPDSMKKIPVISYSPREAAGVPPKSRVSDAVGRSLTSTSTKAAKASKGRVAQSSGNAVGSEGTRRQSTVSPLGKLKRDKSWWGGENEASKTSRASSTNSGAASVETKAESAKAAATTPAKASSKSTWWRPSVLAKRIKQAGKKIWYVEKKDKK